MLKNLIWITMLWRGCHAGMNCDQSKLERAYCLLDLRYKPETTIRFITWCKLADEQDVQQVKHRARMSIDLFYKLHQKGYSSVHVGANGGRWFCSYNKLLRMQMHIQLLNCKKCAFASAEVYCNYKNIFLRFLSTSSSIFVVITLEYPFWSNRTNQQTSSLYPYQAKHHVHHEVHMWWNV